MSDFVRAYEDEIAEWQMRLDRFCAELKGLGFGVERDGLKVIIKTPAPGGSDAAGQAAS